MNKRQIPPDWTAARVNHLIAQHESLSEKEQVAEDEAAVGEQNEQTVISALAALMPAIRRPLADSSGA